MVAICCKCIFWWGWTCHLETRGNCWPSYEYGCSGITPLNMRENLMKSMSGNMVSSSPVATLTVSIYCTQVLSSIIAFIWVDHSQNYSTFFRVPDCHDDLMAWVWITIVCNAGGKKVEVLLVGMNPGPFGMAQVCFKFHALSNCRDDVVSVILPYNSQI